ncbi:MAG: riboflavin synthase, partial [Archangium sp.]|nr:riboflavin synthase [Archangium sp.]
MFTGLVTDLGTVERVATGAMTDLWIGSSYPGDFQLGESISCDGVCLTVVEFAGSKFKVQAAPETLRRSTLGGWAVGTRVNLERALRAGDRLGGHLVQGHVDAVAQVLSARADGGSWA